MSDFSTVKISAEFGLIPAGTQIDMLRRYQTKDLPDDEEFSCCVDGEIEADGRFVREDLRGRFWCPNFDWWVRLAPDASEDGSTLYAHFEAGKVCEVSLEKCRYEMQRPDGVDCIWVRID